MKVVNTLHEKSNNRINWIDNLKGSILLLVCLYHLGMDFTLLTPARMSTFFFLSGYLFSDRRFPTISSYFKSKCNSLLLPYFKLSILFALLPPKLMYEDYAQGGLISKIHSFLQSCKFPIEIQYYITNQITNIIDIISGYSYAYGTGSLWFVYTLFQISCIYFIIDYYTKRCKHEKIVKILFSILSLLAGWILNIYNIQLPFHMHTMLTALFFYSTGNILKETINNVFNTNRKNLIINIIICGGIYFYTYIAHEESYRFISNSLGNKSIFIFVTQTISGIFLLINLFILISKYIENNVMKSLRFIAQNALIILCMHHYILCLCDVFISPNIPQPIYLYARLVIVIIGTIISIPIFRNKLYWFIGKPKISFKECLLKA